MSNLAVMLEQVKGGGGIATQVPTMLAFVEQQTDPAVLQECKAQAAAIAEYLAQRKDQSAAEFNAALKVKLAVQYRLGEVLRETVQPRGAGNTRLPEGVSKIESSRAQRLAAVPWQQIEEQIDQATKKNERATTQRIKKSDQQEAVPQERYPHSAQLMHWLAHAMGETFVIWAEQGGIETLCSEPGKWDQRDVETYIIPQLENHRNTIDDFIEEITATFITKRLKPLPAPSNSSSESTPITTRLNKPRARTGRRSVAFYMLKSATQDILKDMAVADHGCICSALAHRLNPEEVEEAVRQILAGEITNAAQIMALRSDR